MLHKINLILGRTLYYSSFKLSVSCGSENISNLGPRIWNLAPGNLNDVESVSALKCQIKMWQPKR